MDVLEVVVRAAKGRVLLSPQRLYRPQVLVRSLAAPARAIAQSAAPAPAGPAAPPSEPPARLARVGLAYADPCADRERARGVSGRRDRGKDIEGGPRIDVEGGRYMRYRRSFVSVITTLAA